MSGHLDDERETKTAIMLYEHANALKQFTLDNLREVRRVVLDSNCIALIDAILSTADVERK